MFNTHNINLLLGRPNSHQALWLLNAWVGILRNRLELHLLLQRFNGHNYVVSVQHGLIDLLNNIALEKLCDLDTIWCYTGTCLLSCTGMFGFGISRTMDWTWNSGGKDTAITRFDARWSYGAIWKNWCTESQLNQAQCFLLVLMLLSQF